MRQGVRPSVCSRDNRPGEVHPPAEGDAFDLPAQPVCLAKLDLEALLNQARFVVHQRPISRFPAITQDLVVVVEEAVQAARV